MFYEILTAIVLGVIAGTLTGLIPGIHINLISAILVTYSALLLKLANPISIACFVIAMSITHTFIDMIPSVYLGAPDPSTALVVLPAHRMLFKGQGHKAIVLTLLGSLSALIMMILTIPVFIILFPVAYKFTSPYTAIILFGVTVFMILKEKNINNALFVTLLSGLFGILVFKLNISNPLFPMLSGLFGVSTLITSISTLPKLPDQDTKNKRYSNFLKPSITSILSGSSTTIFPGIGPAHAAIIGTQFFKKTTAKTYLVLIGGVGTASMASSLVSYFTLNKARNGSIIAIQHFISIFDFSIMILMYSTALAAGGLALVIALILSKKIAEIINKIDYNKVCISVVVIVTALVAAMTGLKGMVVLLTGTAIGMLPHYLNTGKNTCMGCLLIPVILYFL